MTELRLEPVTLTRRSLMRAGVGTTLLFATGSLITACQSGTTAPDVGSDGWKVLRPRDRAILGAVSPVILAGLYPQDRAQASATLLPQIDAFLYSTNTVNHDALHQLFDLLDIRVIRWTMTGLWSDWTRASDEDIDQFLERWRNSSIGQLRVGYAQLTQIVNLVWFAQPENTASLYPGAPSHTPTPVAQGAA